MNLILDFGNTRIKVAIYNANVLVHFYIFSDETQLMNETVSFSKITHCIISSVTHHPILFIKKFETQFNILFFQFNTALPIINLYKSSSTLGSDRIAACVGSFFEFPNKNVLTIDAGTCIKYNFVNSNNEYLGGAISPGLSMRLKAMHQFTVSLPLIEMDSTYQKLIGETTNESLLSGALLGAAAEVDEIINRYHKIYDNLQIMITGGDADYLCKQLKNRFFTNQNLVLQGLNAILNYNLEK